MESISLKEYEEFCNSDAARKMAAEYNETQQPESSSIQIADKQCADALIQEICDQIAVLQSSFLFIRKSAHRANSPRAADVISTIKKDLVKLRDLR